MAGPELVLYCDPFLPPLRELLYTYMQQGTVRFHGSYRSESARRYDSAETLLPDAKLCNTSREAASLFLFLARADHFFPRFYRRNR